MSRTGRIVLCKEGAEEHLLSDNFPYSGSWIYCCNCQSFIAWEIGRAEVAFKQCPYCLSSLNPRLYACDHCAVTMLDFDDQTLRKHHTVLTWGMPQPACPACHQFPGSTPKMHFCRTLQINLATARPACPFCRVETDEFVVDGAGSGSAKLDAALADAEVRAREAEERRRLAEEAARKEIELRVQAERKAQEIESRVSGQLAQAQPQMIDPELVMKEAEEAKAKAEAESIARADAEARARDAEARAREIEELCWQAEAAAQIEAEMRAMAEMQAREMAERLTTDLSNSKVKVEDIARRNKVAIALYSGIAVTLFFALVLILYSLARLL